MKKHSFLFYFFLWPFLMIFYFYKYLFLAIYHLISYISCGLEYFFSRHPIDFYYIFRHVKELILYCYNRSTIISRIMYVSLLTLNIIFASLLFGSCSTTPQYIIVSVFFICVFFLSVILSSLIFLGFDKLLTHFKLNPNAVTGDFSNEAITNFENEYTDTIQDIPSYTEALQTVETNIEVSNEHTEHNDMPLEPNISTNYEYETTFIPDKMNTISQSDFINDTTDISTDKTSSNVSISDVEISAEERDTNILPDAVIKNEDDIEEKICIKTSNVSNNINDVKYNESYAKDHVYNTHIPNDNIAFISSCLRYVRNQDNSAEETANNTTLPIPEATFENVGKYAIKERQITVSMIQNKFKISFFSACSIIDKLQAYGVISHDNGSYPRRILMSLEDFNTLLKTNKISDNFTSSELSNGEPINYDNMKGFEFEYFCADILKKNDYVNVEVTQGSGDHGVDILAEKDNITYAIQCKCYSSNVGNKAIQQAVSGKLIYKRDIAVVLTNQYFTTQAIDEANSLGVKLWDRNFLDNLIQKASQYTNASTL